MACKHKFSEGIRFTEDSPIHYVCDFCGQVVDKEFVDNVNKLAAKLSGRKLELTRSRELEPEI